MNLNRRYNKNKAKNVKTARTTILFIIITIFVVGGSALMAVKFSEGKQAVQAETLAVNKEGNSELDEETNNSYLLENDPSADDVAFVEKYLDQQMRGEMPDGADGKKVVYLTFDDGPSETVTPLILDVLKAEKVHATFFVVGKSVDESNITKSLIKREVEEGHALGNHTYSHNYNYLYPNKTINVDNFMADINKTSESLKSILGEKFSTRAIRFPGGHMTWKSKDSRGMEAMDSAMKEKDYHQVDWNALSKDAEGAPKNAEQLKQELIKTVTGREKAVVLMHDTYGKEETAKALPEMIKYLKEQGYEFRTMK